MDYFVMGIDTEIGKTFATGLIARYFLKNRQSPVTLKIVQTGCEEISEDIVEHRELMGVELYPEDKNSLTCPYLFKLPASPHLSARLENKKIDPAKITDSYKKLQKKYSPILLEAAGGLMVPLYEDFTILDYAKELKLPIILISSARLGSINHTLLSLKALIAEGLKVQGIVYNHFPKSDPFITEDSIKTLKLFYPEIPIVELPLFEKNNKIKDIDFSSLFD